MGKVASSERTPRYEEQALLGLSRVPIYIVNDVRIYRDGLKKSLESAQGIAVVGAGIASEASFLAIATTRARIVLVDFLIPESLVIAKGIMELSNQPKVIAVGIRNDEDVLACAETGLSGYVPREASTDDLQRVIWEVTENKFVCSPEVAAALVRKVYQLSKSTGFAPNILTQHLTTRQTQIAALLGQGLTNKEIGRRLSICSTTVRNHIHAIFEKLNVKRRAEAVAVLHVNGSGVFFSRDVSMTIATAKDLVRLPGDIDNRFPASVLDDE